MDFGVGLCHFLTGDQVDTAWQQLPDTLAAESAKKNMHTGLQLIGYVRDRIPDFEVFLETRELELEHELHVDLVQVGGFLLDCLILAVYRPSENARLACVTMLAHCILFTHAAWTDAQIQWATDCILTYDDIPAQHQPTSIDLQRMRQQDWLLFTLHKDNPCPLYTPCNPYPSNFFADSASNYYVAHSQPLPPEINQAWKTLVDRNVPDWRVAHKRYMTLSLLKHYTYADLARVPDICDNSIMINCHPDENVQLDLLALQLSLDFDVPELKYSLEPLAMFVILTCLLMSANGLPVTLHFNRSCAQIPFLEPGSLRIWAVCLKDFQRFGVYFVPRPIQRAAGMSGISLATELNPSRENMVAFVTLTLQISFLNLPKLVS